MVPPAVSSKIDALAWQQKQLFLLQQYQSLRSRHERLQCLSDEQFLFFLYFGCIEQLDLSCRTTLKIPVPAIRLIRTERLLVFIDINSRLGTYCPASRKIQFYQLRVCRLSLAGPNLVNILLTDERQMLMLFEPGREQMYHNPQMLNVVQIMGPYAVTRDGLLCLTQFEGQKLINHEITNDCRGLYSIGPTLIYLSVRGEEKSIEVNYPVIEDNLSAPSSTLLDWVTPLQERYYALRILS